MNIANKVSMLRVFLIPLFILFVMYPMQGGRLIAAIVFILISFTDILDGYLARKMKIESSSGRIIDPLADKLLVITGFVLLAGHGIPAWATLIVVLREIIITGLRSLTHSPSKSAFKASWPSKLKTISQMIAVVVVLLEIPYSIYIVYFSVLLTLYSGIEYLIIQRKMIKEFLA